MYSERSGFYGTIRRALHKPPQSLLWKVEDKHVNGRPDSDYCLDGVTGKIEVKYVKSWPKRKPHLTVGWRPGQQKHLRDWAAAGGNAYLLIGVEDTWFLMRPDTPNEVPPKYLWDNCLASGLIKKIGQELYHILRSEP